LGLSAKVLSSAIIGLLRAAGKPSLPLPLSLWLAFPAHPAAAEPWNIHQLLKTCK
jgi:hypothetical protein